MLRIISVGVWVCVVAFATLMLGIFIHKDDPAVEKVVNNQSSLYEFTRTELFTVPVMVDGEVKGYVAAQLIYACDKSYDINVVRSMAYYINDEIYNQLFCAYSNTRLIERIKFNDIRQAIIEKVNERFGHPIVKDIYVQQFGYISTNVLHKKAQEA